jgi:hypothetical protein
MKCKGAETLPFLLSIPFVGKAGASWVNQQEQNGIWQTRSPHLIRFLLLHQDPPDLLNQLLAAEWLDDEIVGPD